MLTLQTEFYKMVKDSHPPPKSFFSQIVYNVKQKYQYINSMEPLISCLMLPGHLSSWGLWCEWVRQHVLCFATHLTLSSPGFPSSKNVLTSFVLSSSLPVFLKHVLFLNS